MTTSHLPPENLVTIPAIFNHQVNQFGDKVALRYKVNGEFTGTYSWNQWQEKVNATAQALKSIGVQSGDKVAIMSPNCPEWTFVDLAVLSLGGVVVPIYPTSSEADVEYILQQAEVKVCFFQSEEHYLKLSQCTDQFLKGGCISLGDEIPDGAVSLDEFMQSSEKVQFIDLSGIQEDQLATLIFTSGTTGRPKGVMLTHSNFIQNFRGASKFISISPEDISLSFLPLSHVFERLAGYYFMAFSGAEIVYAESMLTVADDIKVVKPTVAAAVPRFYEKVFGGISERVEAGSSLQKKIFKWALAVGCEYSQSCGKGALSFKTKFLHKIANTLVFKKIRAALGGRLRFFISGGAPLSKDLAEFFYACNILILEGYGLTETSPVIAVNTEENLRFGTVGKILPNVEVKIAEDGEILTAGPCVMQGYYRNQEATDEVIQGKWFHTGDIGEIDSDGFLKITDRKKDIIVTAGGKNVAPQKIEGLIMRDTLFQQIVLVGDKKPYLVALIYIHPDQCRSFAEKNEIEFSDYEELLKHPEILAWVEGRLKIQMEGLARFETVKYFHLLSNELTLSAGELTPTMKVKRRFVMKKYSDEIDSLYEKGVAFAHENAAQ